MLKNFKYQNMQYMYVVQTSMNFLMLSVTKTLSSFNFGQYPPPPPPPHTHTHTPPNPISLLKKLAHQILGLSPPDF